MSVKASAAEWSERVRAWHASGRSASEFAEAEGYSGKLLRWWGSELTRRARRTPRVQLARLVRVGAPAATLTVVVGGARIEVRSGFDRGLLRDVVDVLGGSR